MPKQFLLRGLLVLYLLLPIAASAQPFSNMFVFGDSLSDTGNLAALPEFSFLNLPPYSRGFSNGDRAVEVLGKSLGLTANPSLYLLGQSAGTNYAVAGGRARGTNPIDLSAQIGTFLVTHGSMAPSDALYIVFIGGNDVRDARDEVDKDLADEHISSAVKSIEFNLNTLVAAGAKAIVVVNVTDMGSIPESLQSVDKTLSNRATELTMQFNAELSRMVQRIEQDLDIDLVEFDLFHFFRLTLNDSIALGFEHKQDECFSSVTFYFNRDCNFDKFVFFDEIHPTKRIHERIGRALFAVVPEFVDDDPSQ